MKKENKLSVIVTAIIIATAIAMTVFIPEAARRSVFEGRDVRCAIQFGRYDDTTSGLITGYGYHILRALAESEGCGMDVLIGRNGENYTDSLKDGAVDLLVTPRQIQDSGLVSIPVDSVMWWTLRNDDTHRAPTLLRWLDDYAGSPEYGITREKYLNTFNNPFNAVRAGIVREHLSPFDSLFRTYSDTLGWDWRLLAAVAYKESRFHIEARSHKGASGLMQITGPTAERYRLQDPIDPERSIDAAVRHLVHLQRIFMSQAANRRELDRMALGAYNAGEGHIKDCIHYAQHAGLPTGTWEDILAVFPLFESDTVTVCDTVRYPPFKILETRSYVEDIYSIWSAFKAICPEP